MPRNGSGSYDLPEAAYVDGTTIAADEMNSNLADIAAALTASLAKDGQTTPTANLPMGAFKFTGLGNGSAATDSVAMGQIFSVVRVQTFTSPPTTVTVTIATPAVMSWTAHGLPVGGAFQVTTTGALPTGMAASTTYYVISSGYGANSFQFSLSPGGAAINTSGSQSGTHTGTPYYVPHTKMLYNIMEGVGGGGAGGGCTAASANIGHGGSGGGAGGYALKTATASDIGSSKAVTIGAAGAVGAAGANAGGNGGDTSVGALMIAKGGTGGGGGNGANVITGGLGGIAGTGDATTTGAPGEASGVFTNGFGMGGGGGSSHFGGGAPGAGSSSAINGTVASGYGGGGGGGASYNGAGTGQTGGAGGAGYVVITEFCWA
jgi:hypothetical protein